MVVMSFGQCIKVADKWLQAIMIHSINRFCFSQVPSGIVHVATVQLAR